MFASMSLLLLGALINYPYGLTTKASGHSFDKQVGGEKITGAHPVRRVELTDAHFDILKRTYSDKGEWAASRIHVSFDQAGLPVELRMKFTAADDAVFYYGIKATHDQFREILKAIADKRLKDGTKVKFALTRTSLDSAQRPSHPDMFFPSNHIRVKF